MIATGNESRTAQAGNGKAAAFGAADCVIFAAAPTFAVMAAGTGFIGGDPANMVCSAHEASPLNSMAVMYALMSAFHLAPWIKLIASWRIVRGFPGATGSMTGVKK